MDSYCDYHLTFSSDNLSNKFAANLTVSSAFLKSDLRISASEVLFEKFYFNSYTFPFKSSN